MAYERINFVDHITPLNADTFNHMDEGIVGAHKSIDSLEEIVGNLQQSGAVLNDCCIINAADFGVKQENDGVANSTALQAIMDDLTLQGGTIYIPAGVYRFSATGSQTQGDHCIKMRSNISMIGDGAATVLKIVGKSNLGLDLFYFNEYVDRNEPEYLENCRFKDFCIDGSDQSCDTYTSAGKGFMFNLIKNCHWANVTVKNTDGTGIGVDCPIHCTITNCVVTGCGKAGNTDSPGASGIGIGFGYSDDENMYIDGCTCVSNKKFGVFFEHQRRFHPEKYTSTAPLGFIIDHCIGYQNYYNFGGIQAINTFYRDCVSHKSLVHGYYFENSENCNCLGCYSNTEANSSFVVSGTATDGGTQPIKDIIFQDCISKYTPYGCKLSKGGATTDLERLFIKGCTFNLCRTATIYTSGDIKSACFQGNIANGAENELSGDIQNLMDFGNSWN